MHYFKYKTKRGDELDLIVYLHTRSSAIKDTLILNYDLLKGQDLANLDEGLVLYIPSKDKQQDQNFRSRIYA